MKPNLKRCPVFCLVLLAALLTGCPSNEYVVELTPHGDTLERRLIFYRMDGTDADGVPNYKAFPEEELAAITRLYPPGSVKKDGERHLARAEFTGAMPKDVGGAGSWTNLSTTMGKAALYAERFRGDDDFATTTAKRLEAVDQLTGLIIGWSRRELGKEPNYETLRRFLDGDFRRDFKNLSLYNWARAISANFNPKADEEFMVRFGQYLNERGYLKLSQLPEWFSVLARSDTHGYMPLIQRLVADRMGLPESAPIPPSLAFLADEDAVVASMEKYFVTAEFYQTRIKQWEGEKKSDPNAPKPEPQTIIGELIDHALEFSMFSSQDQLTVKLSLSAPPIHTNGKWDAARRQVLWEAGMDNTEQSPRLPAFCYATWSTANEAFQKEHFGKVTLEGEDLLQYCLWRASLNAGQAGEWETLLAGLKPDAAVTGKLDAFRFSHEPAATAVKDDGKNHLLSDFPRELLKSALAKAPQTLGK